MVTGFGYLGKLGRFGSICGDMWIHMTCGMWIMWWKGCWNEAYVEPFEGFWNTCGCFLDVDTRGL